MGKGKAMEEEGRTVLTFKDIEKTLKTIISMENLQPYKYLGNGLYELPGCIICNKKGLEEYLKELKK
jgi:hypothetical protein